jgi:hypothetical protein
LLRGYGYADVYPVDVDEVHHGVANGIVVHSGLGDVAQA